MRVSRYPPSNEEEEEPNKGPNYELLSYTVSNSDSDLESTARNGPKCSELEDTCESGVNANGGNGGNGGNNGCSYKGFMACNPKEYDGKGGAIALTRWIEKMENVIDNSSQFLWYTLTMGNEKKGMEETSTVKRGSSAKRIKVGKKLETGSGKDQVGFVMDCGVMNHPSQYLSLIDELSHLLQEEIC
ncbi:hypothetical protein Tco_0970072 [Tanacetum coccineum]